MRPIKLKIKGLNSYIDEQVIDFRKLTNKGLFGIFGPTGSGKSTILDAITIVLYGEISRKSKEYINTNCKDMTISYEFEIGSSQSKRQFIAERTFRKNKDGVVKPKYVRLIEKKHGQSEILAEKTTEMKKCIHEILGLKAEDFTRSVVLPQGKFSEFLKLKGIDKRNMLERIFGLEKYGKEITEKIRKTRNGYLYENNTVEGQLKHYEGISVEIYKEQRNKLVKMQYEQEILKEELELTNKKYEKYKNIWELQKELNSYIIKNKELESKKDEIQKIQFKSEKGEYAQIIKPYIERYRSTLKNLKINKYELDKAKIELENIQKDLVEAQKECTAVEDKQKNDLLKWLVQEKELKNALKLINEINNLEKETKMIKNKIEKILKQRNDNEKKLTDIIDFKREKKKKYEINEKKLMK